MRFECSCEGYSGEPLLLVVRSELSCFERQYSSSVRLRRTLEDLSRHDWRLSVISNAVFGSAMDIVDTQGPVVRIVVRAKDSTLAKFVAETYWSLFREYLTASVSLRYDKTIAKTKERIERAKRAREPVDPQWEDELVRVRKRVERSRMNVRVVEPLKIVRECRYE